MPQAADRKASSDARATSGSRHCHSSLAQHAHSPARTLTCFAFFPTVLEEKKDYSQSTVVAFHVWLAPWVGKMNQILRCDWLPKKARWRDLARPGVPAVQQEKFPGKPYSEFFID